MLLMLLALIPTWAQVKKASPIEAEKTRVLLILDCSNSMWDRWQSDAKIKVTQRVLLHFIDSISHQDNVELALRVFGHLNKEQYGTRLEVPFSEGNIYQLQSKIKTLVPQGGCTAATALTDALHDFPATGSSRNIILIITDGMDDCDAAICNVARHVQMSGTIVQTFILGIGNAKDFQHSLDCAGKFMYVGNEEDYDQALYNIFNQSDQMAKVVMDVRSSIGDRYETEIPVAFYDRQTNVAKYSTIYATDASGWTDTLELDPLVSYDVKLFTKPPYIKSNVKFSIGKLNTLKVIADQGNLCIRRELKRLGWTIPNYTIVVHPHNDPSISYTQIMGEHASYLAGNYDIEVNTLPTINLQNVEIRNGANTDIELPIPGLLVMNKLKVISTGSLFVLEDGIMRWVCDLNPNTVSERLVLLPGEYQAILHPQGAIKYDEVCTKRFKIESAQQTNVDF